VSKGEVLAEVLKNAGFDAEDLIQRASAKEVKDQLRRNTDEALKLGLCGVPSYRVLQEDGNGGWKVNGGLVWGQDELGVVMDLIAGWREDGREVADVSWEHRLNDVKSAAKL
jgi:2-hydroxychromene-2-carboxylate isomerase